MFVRHLRNKHGAKVKLKQSPSPLVDAVDLKNFNSAKNAILKF